ncbi:glycosyltransferase [Fodinibius halophilus]|uniref:Glycosyltransferase n=1 Tax=Fodinibius halophilus TaxID=1736908 RepID=A0A6M1T6Q6_9BACT|nr:glycosyltransferase [Fodinibius halophilus]NGP89789.1 glycosyltransferase [Fodinibius halophilus]
MNTSAEQKPLVSAILTTHNRENLLPRALDSVLEQTYDNLEVVVVDDGSTDNTPTIMQEYKQRYDITYMRLEKSVGACRARNRGIQHARGTFIAGLDDDDTWHKQRINMLMNAYTDDYACVCSDIDMVFPRGKAVWKKQKVVDLETLLYTNQVGNQVLVKRDRLLKVGGFDPELEAAQDYDLWIRLCDAYGPIRNVQQPLQTIFMDREEGRITSRSAGKGYLQFYNKHKKRLSRAQRKYQLFNIRRAQQKPLSLTEFIFWVPGFRYWDEFKKIISGKWWH